MYRVLSVLAGCAVAVLVAINGGLSARTGIFSATVIIHVVGTLFAFLLLRLRRQAIGLSRAVPLWAMTGGAIGVLTVLCNIGAFGRISMTSIVALGLLGQTLSSLAIDSMGLFGMTRRRLGLENAAGLVLAALGMWVMLAAGGQSAALGAVALSMGAGVSVVLSRSVNARLSLQVGALSGSFVNHAVGLAVAVLLLPLFGSGEPIFAGARVPTNPVLYAGGLLGVVVVLLFNVTVPKLSALHLTLLTFAGQVLTGVAIDAVANQHDAAQMIGGVLVAAGVLLNSVLEHAMAKRAVAKTSRAATEQSAANDVPDKR